ncbi:MAG: tetratricopeptide repeat protein [Bacillota bacterium]
MELKTIKKKALRGKKDAQFDLGMRFLRGHEVSKDEDEAEKWFKHAAKKDHPEALYQLALLKIDNEEYKLAESFLRRAVKKGFPKAYKPLGAIYKGSFDPSLEDKHQASLMLYNYYDYDNYDGLDPLLSVYKKDVFPSIKHAHAFLEEAMNFGLIKAKFHLALLYLTEKKYEDIGQALDYLEDYYAATADVNAAKELYYLYAPKENKYPKAKEKDPARAREFLKRTLEGNGMLEGTEFVGTYGLYLPKQMMPVETYIEKMIKRMKTSLAIDQDFSSVVTRDTFDISLRFDIETIYDYNATISYKQKVIEKEIIEKEITKKQTVRKGLKKTGSVKIPKIIRKVKKHKHWEDKEYPLSESNIEEHLDTHIRYDSIKEVLARLKSLEYIFEFSNVTEQAELKKTIEHVINAQFKKPKRSKKIKKDYSYQFIYLATPKIHVEFNHQKEQFKQDIDLSNAEHVEDLIFPLDKYFSKIHNRFLWRQGFLKQNHLIFSLLMALLIPLALIQSYTMYLSNVSFISTLFNIYVYHGLSIIIGLLIGYGLYKILNPDKVSSSQFIRWYDDADNEQIKRTRRMQLTAFIIKLAIVLLFVGINIYLFNLI